MWCDVCGGSGYAPIPDDPEFHVDEPCPNCDGTGLDPERLERAAKAAWDDSDPTPGMQWELLPEKQRGRVSQMATAAITEYLRKDD